MAAQVDLKTQSLDDLFIKSKNLHIPDYQRIYCWQEKNVYKLLNDIWNVNKDYHMGSIILQNKDDKLCIIDGQQRLITLTLILNELGDLELPLLDEKIESSEAAEYIAYNKYLISGFVKRINPPEGKKKEIVLNLRKNLKFAVLTLKDDSLDLAYTFFSSQNSKGVPLNSYELLKSHHLHFIPDEKQAVHMAKRWDAVLLNKKSDEGVLITLGMYLFHMRKWMRQEDWDDKEKLKEKEEFESALTIPEIPPFGERFIFNEPIQGGTHFFAYTDFFINRCREFHQTEMYGIVHRLDGETHYVFRDVIETILFAYYLKFGDLYMAEAFVCISKIISQYRYEAKRIDKPLVYKNVSNRNFLIMHLLEQASSPTFFLAAARDVYLKMKMYEDGELSPIARRYKGLLNRLMSSVKQKIVSATFAEELNG